MSYLITDYVEILFNQRLTLATASSELTLGGLPLLVASVQSERPSIIAFTQLRTVS